MVLIGIFFVVGGVGVVNNFYDCDIDVIMKCMKDRLMVIGVVNFKFVLWLGLVLFVIGVGILFLVFNMVVIMGILGFFFYVVFYIMFIKCIIIYNIEVGSISGVMFLIIGWVVILSDLFYLVVIGLFVFMFLW